MNKAIMIGNVCHTPETATTPTGKTVCRFEIAVNKRRGGEDKTEYIRVSAWNKLGETCQQYLTKGRKVCAVGEIGARAYTSKDGTAKCQLELTADEVEFLSAAEQPAQPKATEGWDKVDERDLPF